MVKTIIRARQMLYWYFPDYHYCYHRIARSSLNDMWFYGNLDLDKAVLKDSFTLKECKMGEKLLGMCSEEQHHD